MRVMTMTGARAPAILCGVLAVAHAGMVPQVRPSDVLIRSLIGSVGFTTVTDWEYSELDTGARVTPSPLDSSNPSRTTEDSGAAVRLFAGEMRTGERLLMKEYISSAGELAATELAAYERLYTVWRAMDSLGGRAGDDAAASVSALVGFMESGQSFADPVFLASWAVNMRCDPPAVGNPWLLFRFEGLRTAANWPPAVAAAAAQRRQQPAGGLGALAQLASVFGGRSGPQAASADSAIRGRFVRAFARGALRALCAVHGAGVAHRGLGPACFGLSTLDERAADTLSVRIDNFGFALTLAQAAEDIELVRRARAAAPAGAEQPSPEQLSALLERDDLRALGYTLLEVLLAAAEGVHAVETEGAGGSAPSSPADKSRPAPAPGAGGTAAAGASSTLTAPPPPPPPPRAPAVDQASLRRLLEDVYGCDVRRFRAYCEAEPRWREAVELLDSAAGEAAAAAQEPREAAAAEPDAPLGGGWLLLADLLGDGTDEGALRSAALMAERPGQMAGASAVLRAHEQWLRA